MGLVEDERCQGLGGGGRSTQSTDGVEGSWAAPCDPVMVETRHFIMHLLKPIKRAPTPRVNEP